MNIQLLRQHLANSDRLIIVAAESLSTFYNSASHFFVRDSLDQSDVFTTGGASALALLVQLESYLNYLDQVLGAKSITSAIDKCKEASESFASGKEPFSLGSQFGEANHFTMALAAQVSLFGNPASDRSIILGRFCKQAFNNHGWPTLLNVAEPHPFVARQLLIAADHNFAPAAYRDIEDVDSGNFTDDSAEFIKSLTVDPPLNPNDARARFLSQTISYLWKQVGYGSPIAQASQSYDPVGACHALDMLVRLVEHGANTSGVNRFNEFEELILQTVYHVLGSVTTTGSLPYGMPFSYSAKGMGAFATSISGLAAFSLTLARLMKRARHNSYPNAQFLEQLITAGPNMDLLKLLSLPVTLLAAQRNVESRKGWCTDRAPSLERVEAWVTADVLAFGVGVRELSQEIAQFLVSTKYSAIHVSDEPLWPYQPKSRLASSGEHNRFLLLDPDMPEPDEWCVKSPVQSLHDTFGSFMEGPSSSWCLKKSTVLLFGPPGTAKSTVARSLAQALNWQFMELTPSNFVDQGLELVEQRSREIFEELAVLRETVILFDELDSLLTDRELLTTGSILAFAVPALLPKLQQLAKSARKQRLILVFATNFYDRLDPAMVRRGRIDERIVVLPHNANARKEFFAARNLKVTDISESAGAVHEDLSRYAERYPDAPVIGLSPSLYLSRLPANHERRTRLRSTQRLAIEVLEVVGRIRGQQRMLDADSSPAEIDARLNQLKGERLDEWSDLLAELGEALLGRTDAEENRESLDGSSAGTRVSALSRWARGRLAGERG